MNPSPYFLTLLQTRLQPPFLPADITARPRVNRLVQRDAARKLLLVSAPAGYGKTTAVLCWVQQQAQPIAWLALDAATDDLNSFVAYVAAAVQRVVPDACTRSETLAEGGQAPAALLPFLHWQEIPALTAVRVLAVAGEDAALRRALDLLEPLAAWAERSHCTLRVAACMALRAVALDRLGRTQAADEAMHTALHIGEGAGYRRTLLDIGPRLQPLLLRQTRRKSTAAMARLLLHALADEPGEKTSSAAHAGEYVEALTPREQDVLTLLARRYTNKEIAQELLITTNTVKRHMLQIFTKLGVNNRRTAVERAHQIGLLRNAP